MARIQEIVPENEWPYLLLCGDWNIDINAASCGVGVSAYVKQKAKRMESVVTICKQMNLSLKYPEQSQGVSTIDYVMHGSALVVENVRTLEDR